MAKLSDVDPAVRERAVSALVSSGLSAVPALIVALAGWDAKVRSAATKALVGIGEPVMSVLGQFGEEAAAVLVRALERHQGGHDWDEVAAADIEEFRRWVVGALVWIGEPAIPALIRSLYNDAWYTKDLVVEMLGRLGEPAILALVANIGDQYLGFKNRVVEALVWIGEPAVSALIEAIRDEKSEVRAGACEALGLIGSSAASLSLIPALQDESENVRAAAHVALSRIGPISLSEIPPPATGLARMKDVEKYRRVLETYYAVVKVFWDTEKKDATIKFGMLAKRLGRKDSTLRLHVREASGFLHRYFDEVEGVPLESDDSYEDPENKLLTRWQGARGITINKYGWIAWDLVGKFLGKEPPGDKT